MIIRKLANLEIPQEKKISMNTDSSVIVTYPFSFCLIHCIIIFHKPWLRVWINIEIFNIMKYSIYHERIVTIHLCLERKQVSKLHRANGLLTKTSILYVTRNRPQQMHFLSYDSTFNFKNSVQSNLVNKPVQDYVTW